MSTTGTTTTSAGTQITANGFIPTKWEAGLQYNYAEKTALPLITWEPDDIDTHTNQLVYNFMNPVKVTSGKLSTFGGTIPVQQASTKPVTIPIDDFSAWAVSVTTQQLVQGSADLIQGSTVQSAMDIATEVDTIVYQNIISSAGTTLPKQTVSLVNAYDTLVNMVTPLNWANVPKWGRYIVIDPTYLGMLSKDPRFTNDPHVLENGVVEGQKIAGAEIICTTSMNYTPADTTSSPATNAQGQAFVIQRQGYGFGQQFVDTEMVGATLGSFLRGVQGMMIYGYGVLRPNNIVACNVEYQNIDYTDVQEVVEV